MKRISQLTNNLIARPFIFGVLLIGTLSTAATAQVLINPQPTPTPTNGSFTNGKQPSKKPPSSCPGTNPNCIWLCTGQDPLDGIDDDTCSTKRYVCYGCGSNGEDVYKPAE